MGQRPPWGRVRGQLYSRRMCDKKDEKADRMPTIMCAPTEFADRAHRGRLGLGLSLDYRIDGYPKDRADWPF